MRAPDRYELMTRLVRLERELLFVRRKLKDQKLSTSLPQGTFQAVRVQVGGGEYAIPSSCVRQIIHYAPPAPIKLTATAITGVLTIRGEPIVVLDLGERLGFGRTPADCESALLIASVHDSLVAFVIERVTDAIQLAATELHVPSIALLSACVAAVGTHEGRLVQVLELDQLISIAELELLTLSIESA